MFSIIGGDGKEYGPVTTDQVRGWISTGRANLDTKAKAAGSEDWRRLGDFAEFGGAAATVPPLMGGTPAPAGVADAAQIHYASHGARIGAALLNALVYFFCIMPGAMAMSLKLVKDNPQMTQPGFVPRLEDMDITAFKDGAVWVFGGLSIAILFQLLLLAWRGQNLGKLVFGAKVVRADNGEPAGFVRAGLLRFVVPVFLFFALNLFMMMGCIFLLVDFCFMFRADRRCLHDLIAGTMVVKSRL